jgi:hypothetical protein
MDAQAEHSRWNHFDDRSASHADGSSAQEPTSPRKKPYTKPTYRYEQVFETMALACGKISATQFQCRFHRHNS